MILAFAFTYDIVTPCGDTHSPSFSFSVEEKVECFVISFAPVRSEIELHNRRYWDSLAASLYYSIMRDVTILQNYISESKKSLDRQPQTLDDIGEINAVHKKILETSKQVSLTFISPKCYDELDQRYHKEINSIKNYVHKYTRFRTI